MVGSMHMIGLVAAIALINGCGSPPPKAPSKLTPKLQETGFSADVKQQRDGSWSVSYQFDRPRPALLFDSSGGDRSANWTPRNAQGTKVENLHGLDALLLDPPSSQAHFSVLPPKAIVEGTQPFLVFSDGSVAIHLGQFPVLTVSSRAEAEALRGNLGKWSGEQPTVEVKLSAQEPMLMPDGVRAANGIGVPVRSGGGYVYVGNIEPVQTDDLVAVIDPGLPGWLSSRFYSDIANVYRVHKQRWGAQTKRATILLAFGGSESGGSFQNKGYASGQQLSMAIRGKAYASENPEALQNLLWFFAHEAAHQFQFRDGVSREAGSDWISEGAANTMAVVVLHDLGMMNKGQLERRYWQTHRECTAELHDGPLQGKRGRSGYVCGDIIAAMSAASLPKHDLFGFWNTLRERAKQEDDGKLTAAGYFALLRELGADSSFVDSLEQLIGTRLEDPSGKLAEVMQASGLDPKFADDGGLSTLRFEAILSSK